MARSNAQTVEDALDRAATHSRGCLQRIQLSDILFWPGNRGGQGIIPFHVHEVAHDIVVRKVRLERYDKVVVIEIPADMRDAVIAENASRATTSPYMPRVDARQARYMCFTKTHFTHALKIIKDGNRTLYNQGQVPLTLKDDDKEGTETLMSGPLCQVYNASILKDMPAAIALASTDNLNANVCMSETELDVLSNVHVVMMDVEKDYRTEHNTTHLSGYTEQMHAQALKKVEQLYGFLQWDQKDWGMAISLRGKLGEAPAKLLLNCVSTVCAGRVRVRFSDFETVAKLDKCVPLAMVCILLHQYISNMHDVSTTRGSSFSGRSDTFAQCLAKDSIGQLTQQRDFCLQFQANVRAVLADYSTIDNSRREALGNGASTYEMSCAQAHALSGAGKLLKLAGSELQKEQARLKGVKQEFDPTQRERFLYDFKANKMHLFEKVLRQDVVKRGLFTDDALKHKEWQFPENNTPGATTTGSSAQPTSGEDKVRFRDGDNETWYTLKELFESLGITGVGDNVLAWVASTKQGLEDPPPPPAGQDDADAEPPAAKRPRHVQQDKGDLPPQPTGQDAAAAEQRRPNQQDLVDTPTRFKAESEATVENEGVDGVGVTDVCEAGTEAAAERCNGKWTVVKLASFIFPDDAVVEVPGADASEAYTMKCLVSTLKQAEKKEKEKTINRHPAEETKAGVVLPKHSYSAISDDCMRGYGQVALVHCHLALSYLVSLNRTGEVEQLEVKCISEEQKGGEFKLPIALQVTCTSDEGYKPGHLVLFPYVHDPMRLDSKETEVALEHNNGTVHEHMLDHVRVVVKSSEKKCRGKRAEPNQEQKSDHPFILFSPVLAGKELRNRKAALRNVPPFWALPQAGRPGRITNMKLVTMTVTIPPCVPTDGSPMKGVKFSSTFATTVDLPIAINTKMVRKGDLLVLEN